MVHFQTRAYSPRSPKSPHSANVSACLRAVDILCLLDRAQMWFGAAAMRSFAEKRSDGPVSPHLRMTQYHSLEIFYPHEGNVARDPTPPIEQGEMEEPWPLLPSFPFSPSWWKGLQTGQPRSIRAVNKKEAFRAMKTRRGRVHLCLLKMQSVTPNHKPANSSTSHPSHARALPSSVEWTEWEVNDGCIRLFL